jgi:hypothetical protein
MCAFHPNAQLALLENGFDPLAALRQSLTKKVPWESIVDFATHPSFCGQSLYPRQQTLLRLIYLETEHMTAYDLDVIEQWRHGFQLPVNTFGVQPDIWERVEYLKRRGYRRFPHIQAVLGRRASKGFIGAILAAEQIGYLIALDNPQRFYNIREGKDVFLNVGATSQTQAQRHQFADIRDVVEGCEWLQPYIAETKDHQMRLRTPADLRKIASLRTAGVAIEHTIASLWCVALSASSVAGRGATSYANFFDEFAFHVQGSGSTKSGEEIYEDWQPSLGQFKLDKLTYVPSSPFTMVGKFYELYQQGSVLMNSYQDDSGVSEAAAFALKDMQMRGDLDEVELSADPTMLILQGPSWILYEDWEKAADLGLPQAPFAPENDMRDEEQQRRQLKNPEKFAVERLGQFAEVMGQYLDPIKVDAMFKVVPWRNQDEDIPGATVPTAFGRFDYTYRIHVDPSKSGANFALSIGHTEMAPCDKCGAMPQFETNYTCRECREGVHWPHVIIDRLKVWQAKDFPVNPETNKYEIDYTVVEHQLSEILRTFPSTTTFSSDQWNSVGFLQRLRKKYPSIRVIEDTATESANWTRAEKFKSALNLGWVHSYADDFYEGKSLLRMECKFLSERNGKVYKQEFGPVQTKDLYDAVSTVVVDLLSESLERWDNGTLGSHSYGSTNVAGLRSGRELERSAVHEQSNYLNGVRSTGTVAWDKLMQTDTDRMVNRHRGQNYQQDRTRSFRPNQRRY